MPRTRPEGPRAPPSRRVSGGEAIPPASDPRRAVRSRAAQAAGPQGASGRARGARTGRERPERPLGWDPKLQGPSEIRTRRDVGCAGSGPTLTLQLHRRTPSTSAFLSVRSANQRVGS